MEPNATLPLPALRLGEPRQHRNLTLFPVHADGPPSPLDYLLLDDTLTAGLVEITEVSEGGHVPELRLSNRAERPVLIVDGEEVVGAKQNRIFNVTILVAAQTTIVIPVSCVERGRWSSRSATFGSEQRLFSSRGRARKSADVADSVAEDRGFVANQGAVWAEVDSKMAALGVFSHTSAFADVQRTHEVSLDDYRRALQPDDGQVGALFAIDGRIAGMDFFDRPETYQRLYGKLVTSYGLDALETLNQGKSYPKPVKKAAAFAASVATMTGMARSSVSLGQDVRLTGNGVIGAALVHEGMVVHLCAFPHQDGQSRDGGRMARASRRRREFSD